MDAQFSVRGFPRYAGYINRYICTQKNIRIYVCTYMYMYNHRRAKKNLLVGRSSNGERGGARCLRIRRAAKEAADQIKTHPRGVSMSERSEIPLARIVKPGPVEIMQRGGRSFSV